MSRSLNTLAEIDWTTVFLYLLLVLFGWMNIYAVNLTGKETQFFSLENRYALQLIWMGVSFLLALMISLIDSRFFSFIAYPAYAFAILVLILVILVGKEVNSSKSWIVLGPISLQPSEFAKLATVLALSKFLSGFNVKPSRLKHLLTALAIIAGPPLFIMLQPDFGSTLVYGILILVLYREGLPGWILLLIGLTFLLFLSSFLLHAVAIYSFLTLTAFVVFALYYRSRKRVLFAVGILLMLVLIFILVDKFNLIALSAQRIFFASLIISSAIYLAFSFSKKIKGVFLSLLILYTFIGFVYSFEYVFNNILKQHQRDRVEVMLGLKSDPWGYEYNVNQSKIAIGSGGFSGKGFLEGTQTKLKYVPEQSTDFIFCTVGEEWGFLGSFGLVAAYVGLLIRLIILAERQRSRFSRIYGYGLMSIIFFHFAVNIAMTIGLFPVIGIPLPFLSYGGSSLMAFTIMLFIFLRLDSTRKAYLI